MNKKEQIENEIIKTLDCFDQSERLSSNPYFYTRVKARIDSENRAGMKWHGWQSVWSILRPVLLVLIVAINVYTIGSYLAESRDHSESSREQMIQAFAREFSLNVSSNNPLLSDN